MRSTPLSFPAGLVRQHPQQALPVGVRHVVPAAVHLGEDGAARWGRHPLLHHLVVPHLCLLRNSHPGEGVHVGRTLRRLLVAGGVAGRVVAVGASLLSMPEELSRGGRHVCWHDAVRHDTRLGRCRWRCACADAGVLRRARSHIRH